MTERVCPFDALQMHQPRLKLGLGFPQAMTALYERGPWPDVAAIFPHITDLKELRRIEYYLAAACVTKKAMANVKPVGIVSARDAFFQITTSLHDDLEKMLRLEVNSLETRTPQLDKKIQTLLEGFMTNGNSFLDFLTIPSDTIFRETRDVGEFLEEKLDGADDSIEDVLRLTGRRARNLRLFSMSRMFDFFKHSSPLHEDSGFFEPIRWDVLELVKLQDGGMYVDLNEKAAWGYVENILADGNKDALRIGCPAVLAGAISRAYDLVAESVEISKSGKALTPSISS